MNISVKNEKELNNLIDESHISSRINSLNKLFISILLQFVVCLINHEIFQIFLSNINYFILTIFMIITIIVSLFITRKNQIKIKQSKTLSILSSILLGIMGSLIILNISNTYLNYTLFLVGMITSFIYNRYLSHKINETQILLIMIGIKSIISVIVFSTIYNNILFICISFLISVYFNLCLFLYSKFALSDNLITFEKNLEFYNLTSFTCELYVFPYTLIIDVYYKKFDIRKSLNFNFIGI